jgi:methionyl aminopeptidase
LLSNTTTTTTQRKYNHKELQRNATLALLLLLVLLCSLLFMTDTVATTEQAAPVVDSSNTTTTASDATAPAAALSKTQKRKLKKAAAAAAAANPPSSSTPADCSSATAPSEAAPASEAQVDAAPGAAKKKAKKKKKKAAAGAAGATASGSIAFEQTIRLLGNWHVSMCSIGSLDVRFVFDLLLIARTRTHTRTYMYLFVDPRQTEPIPTIPVSKQYPDGQFPVGEIQPYLNEYVPLVHWNHALSLSLSDALHLIALRCVRNSYRTTSEELRHIERLQWADMYEEVRLASEVHRQTRKYAQSIIKPGIKLIDLCDQLEAMNRKLIEENGLKAGIAFPTGCRYEPKCSTTHSLTH